MANSKLAPAPLESEQDIHALYQLGLRHVKGDGVPQDFSTAISLLRKAADHEHPDALFVLGALHQKGEGVPRDAEKALDYFSRAAAKGHVVAQFNLGFCYETGEGTKADPAEAIRWYALAAEQGDEDSKLALEDLRAAQKAPVTTNSPAPPPGCINGRSEIINGTGASASRKTNSGPGARTNSPTRQAGSGERDIAYDRSSSFRVPARAGRRHQTGRIPFEACCHQK